MEIKTMNNENNQIQETKKILLVDDDADYMLCVTTYLEKNGFITEKANTRKDGELLVANGDYDMAVFDLMMEESDSGFILSYKSKKTHPEKPVIIVTNVAGETGLRFDVSTKEMKEWVKADAILDKGIPIKELANKIKTLVCK